MFRYGKSKSKFQLIDGELVLIGVPVPRDKRWGKSSRVAKKPESSKMIIMKVWFHSHFLHDIYFRLQHQKQNGIKKHNKRKRGDLKRWTFRDLTLTSRILEELKEKVERRGAKLVVGLIPSKREIEKFDTFLYQKEIAKLCQQLDIEYLDLAPNFKNTWYRTYYRYGVHWNAHGHKIAAEALYDDFMTRNVAFEEGKEGSAP